MKFSNRLIELDGQLLPFEKEIQLRMKHLESTTRRLGIRNNDINSFASGHLYFGFHRQEGGWVYREWAPSAKALFLIGDFNGWNRTSHPMKALGNGVWEIVLPGRDTLPHESQVKVCVHSRKGDFFDRIPLYCRRVVALAGTAHYNGQIWAPPKEYQWKNTGFMPSNKAPMVYEAHIGIAGEKKGIAGFSYFTRKVLPRIQQLGYNTLQLMAIPEHPYYASFGYQVTNFFAVSSRYGTPEEFKKLVDTAHGMGIAVLLDIVHSHLAPNTLEGIAEFDGTEYQFCPPGQRGRHPEWGSRLFEYGKGEVLHFLLSNLKYWLEEYHLDGFRFDGMTSMLYHSHGLNECFTHYRQYFSGDCNLKAFSYLQLATQLCRQVNPHCLLIAEEMSGLPGVCLPVRDGGLGFDYRLGMGLADHWAKLAARHPADWDLGELWHEVTSRRPAEKVMGYCESHDQAIVGKKTLMLWLAGESLYHAMSKSNQDAPVRRAVALHKTIRLLTCFFGGEGYLTFMGNEFGHPDWIDLPREGNGWSYFYATRRWHLAEDDSLLFSCLRAFDQRMLALRKEAEPEAPVQLVCHEEKKRLLVVSRGENLFVFYFGEGRGSFTLDLPRRYSEVLLNTEDSLFGGKPASKKLVKIVSDVAGSWRHCFCLPAYSGVVLGQA